MENQQINHYVDNKAMLQELKNFQQTKIISETLGEMFLKIAQRYASSPSFFRYPYKQDMIAEAVYRMVKKVDKFDPYRKDANPFAYFTLLARRQFLSIMKREKMFLFTTLELRKQIWDDMESQEGVSNVKDLLWEEYNKDMNEKKRKLYKEKEERLKLKAKKTKKS
jgi:DNA-directed RNA polymerase specialized sigma24 family protein